MLRPVLSRMNSANERLEKSRTYPDCMPRNCSSLRFSIGVRSDNQILASRGGLNGDSFDLVERNLVASAVVEPGRFRVGMAGHALGDLQLSIVPKVIGNSGRTEGVVADLGIDSCLLRPAPYHAPSINAA